MNSNIIKYCFFLAFLSSVKGFGIKRQVCSNRFDGKQVRATGDWSFPLWNAAEPYGLMKFDPNACVYSLSLGGLRPSTQYKWKVVIDNSWKENYGCSGVADCVFTSNANGEIRLTFAPNGSPPKLNSEQTVAQVDVKLPCNNKFNGKQVRAAGDWSGLPLWNAVEPLGLMSFDSAECVYSLVLSDLKPNFQYKWKVVIDNSWVENYGCNGLKGPDCAFKTSNDGAIRLLFKPDTLQLSNDNNFVLPVKPTGETIAPGLTTTTPKSLFTTTPTPAVTVNPVKPCTSGCPQCNNKFASKLLRVTGDWAVDLSSAKNWDAAEAKGLLTFDQKLCAYTLVLLGLKKSADYRWKMTANNDWKENYGCNGQGDCLFKSNSAGAIRFVIKVGSNAPQLTTDFNVAECGDDICELGETCSFCPEDCGECPPPVCGDGICEEGESYLTCPSDCTNELPNCERFNDESCRSGSQFHANEGVEKRRWQTPKPGAKNYQASYQDFHSLVGYADIRYTSPARSEADVCIIAISKGQVTLNYYFNDVAQSDKCKRFSTAHKGQVSLRVEASDGAKLEIPAVDLAWNAQSLKARPGDYRNGQKGAVAEMFGWPHKDVEKECELLAKAGYLGVKLFPIHEQLMSTQPFNNALNPWYFMYQPISYKLDGRAGTREELQSLINKCRSLGLRVYADIILNHFTGAGNDMNDHRNPSAGCSKWGNKTSSAPLSRQSPFYTHAYTYKYNPNTGQPPSNEFPGAALGPDDFHCERSLGSWSDPFILNNGWLVGLTDIDTSKENVRERQAAYLVEMMSMGISGFRVDAAKHISPEDLSAILKKVQTKMGGKLPDDFFTWLEIITGGEAGILWTGIGYYGKNFDNMLIRDLGSQSEVDKIKLWDGLYPKEPFNNPASKVRVVIQNDDHDQQNPGSTSRDMAQFGCVLVKNCPENEHRNYEIKLFESPFGVGNNADDWPIRFVLSSYYHTYGPDGIPDGLSDCSLCRVTCESCKPSVPYMPAYVEGECAYRGKGYTRVHRDVKIINAMRKWINLGPISGADIGLPGCN